MKIKVIAIVVSPSSVVLYKEDGESITIAQGNISAPNLVTQAIADIQKDKVATIELTSTNVADEFSIYEKKTGIAKFFRVAKAYTDSLFGENGSLIPQQVGEIPDPEEAEKHKILDELLDEEEELTEEVNALFTDVEKKATPAPQEVKPKPETPKQQSKRKHRAAIKEIMGQEEVTRPAVHTLDSSKQDAEEVTVAIVGDTIIPNADDLQKQVVHAVNTNRTEGMNNLLTRLSTIIHERAHSAEDLVKFLSTGDLPIMDDGSILAYKRVTSISEAGIYVDTHSKKVRQKVGSEVVMDARHVDPSRRNSCSYGLHVATRSYLRGFEGDTILFIKVAPEDAIAVPSYENTKIRVCRYQVIGKASPEVFSALISNRSLESAGAKQLISNMLAGNHAPITQRVKLNSKGSSDITYEDISPTTSPKSSHEEKRDIVVEAVPEVPDEVVEKQAHSIDARTAVSKKAPPQNITKEPEVAALKEPLEKVAKQKAVSKPKAKPKAKTKAKASTKRPPSVKAQIAGLLPVSTKEGAEKVFALKRKAKKGWGALGVSDEQSARILELLK